MGLIDLTGFGKALNLLSLLYWVLAITALYSALKNTKTLRARIVWTLVAVCVFGFLPVMGLIDMAKKKEQAQLECERLAQGAS